nr:hypothetical protein [Kitasatospora sp. MMS16-BH015]
MWEARAAEGRAAELREWAAAEAVPAVRGAAGLTRTELFTAPGERVLVITWWTGEPVALPEPPAGLLARPVHRWSFTSELVE